MHAPRDAQSGYCLRTLSSVVGSVVNNGRCHWLAGAVCILGLCVFFVSKLPFPLHAVLPVHTDIYDMALHAVLPVHTDIYDILYILFMNYYGMNIMYRMQT